jgi:hypothetical protein
MEIWRVYCATCGHRKVAECNTQDIAQAQVVSHRFAHLLQGTTKHIPTMSKGVTIRKIGYIERTLEKIPWSAFGYAILLLAVAFTATVLLFLYAFLLAGPWSPFLWAAGFSLAAFMIIKLIALAALNDKRQLDLAAMYWELLGGAFGWTWLPLGILSLVLFFKALFLGGRWSHFLISLLASSVCKWQMTTCINSKEGAIFKRELVEKGMTKDEAREVWISEIKRRLNARTTPPSS